MVGAKAPIGIRFDLLSRKWAKRVLPNPCEDSVLDLLYQLNYPDAGAVGARLLLKWLGNPKR